MSISEKRIFRSYGMITMGTFLMALGTCLIYEPMSMVTGGFSGVGDRKSTRLNSSHP